MSGHGASILECEYEQGMEQAIADKRRNRAGELFC